MSGVLQEFRDVSGGVAVYANEAVRTRVQLRIAGQVITQILSINVDRDLRDIAGKMDAQILDFQRDTAALGASETVGAGGTTQAIVAGMAFTVLIDGAPVMVGNIDKVHTKWTAGTLTTAITGRDKTGDLVDCAAVPYGPAEFKGVDLLHVAQVLCKPFGLPVRADIDVGAPFERLAIGPHETVMSALEKGARQRSALLVSDGVGGLLITQGGSSRAPAPLVLGDNVYESEGERSWEHRFSDYFVKGQTEKCNGARKGVKVHLDATVVPFTEGGSGAGKAAPAAVAAPEASAILMTGHATDPEITRWRPTVRMTRSQSGMSTTQQQAEWALRVARGEADLLTYTVLDWRAAPDDDTGTLWLPNQVTAVSDPVAQIDRDMLIAGVRYQFDARGLRTTMRVVGVTAYDRINESEKHKPRLPAKKKSTGPLDSSVTPLDAP